MLKRGAKRRSARRTRYDLPASPANWMMARFADAYWRIVWTAMKMALGAVCGVVIVGCVWLLVKIISLP